MPIKVPKDREVPFGAITPAPIKTTGALHYVKLADCPSRD